MPAEIGEYRLIRPLGRGGMGEVFLAEDRALERKVAIKLIAGVRDEPDVRARFALEAKAVARLKHPNVVTVYRSGELDGRPYLVSEYIEGTPLDQLHRPVPRERALSIAVGLARGLAAAHREGVLHRDVKPANAIVDREGVVKLLDFGLAKLGQGAENTPTPRPTAASSATSTSSTSDAEVNLDATLPAAPSRAPSPAISADQRSTITAVGGTALGGVVSDDLTLAGTRLGTPRYMSPEAWKGRRLSAASDVYSLGILVWELLAGRHPYEGIEGDALAARVILRDPPSIRDAVPDLPQPLVAVIDRATRRDADARYADAGALLAELERALVPSAPVSPRRTTAVMVGSASIAVLAGLAGVAYVATRSPSRLPSVAAPVTPAATASDAGPLAPTALTMLGGCADTPAFLDATTIAFAQSQDDFVDVMVTAGSGSPSRLVASPTMDYRPAAGRHRGELLYIRDRDDGTSELVALDRASGLGRRIASATSAVVVGDEIYLLTGELPGQLARVAGDHVEPVATMPAARVPYVISAARGAPRIAVVVADPESPPGLCIVELVDRSVRCPATERLVNGSPAMTQDGRFIYYAARAGIRRIDTRDDSDTLAVAGAHANGGLTLSPDDRRLVFSDCRTYGSIVAIGDATSEVLVEQGLVKHPSGGPDGLLAWVGVREGGGTRLLVRGPGQHERQVAEAATEIGRPAFDRSGTRLAYADGGEGGGVRSIPVAGGAPEVWTLESGDRAPVWTADGGIAFTRLGDGGAPAVVHVAAPGAAARVLLEGWTVEDVDASGRKLLVMKSARELGLLDIATRAIEPVALGTIAGQEIIGANLAPDGTWIAVLAGPIGSTFYKLDFAGHATAVHQLPSSQTAGPPTVLSDGRIAFRPEIWLGELYELEGRWATP